VLRTGKRVVHYAMVTLPSVAAATNGPSATAARLDKLRRLAKQVPGEGVSGLLPALGDRSPTVRALAAWSLSAAGDPELAHALRPLLDDDAERVRASAAWALGQLRALVAADWLAACVRADPSDLVRYRAVAGLGALGQPAVLPVLLEALGDSAAAVREQAAISALPLLGNGALPKKLSEQACSTKPATRRLALVLIGRSGGDGAEAALRAGLNDPEPVVCAEAILGLGRQRLPLKPDELRRLQAHADEHVRGAVAHALWLRGEQSADVVLRELLQDPHPFVRAVAAEGLGQWGITVVKPPSGFSAAETFSYPF
jgi:HEAT repeat protein